MNSVGIALKILEYVAHHPDSGVNEIAKQVSVDKSTISRQLSFLESCSYVIKTPLSGKFRLGHKLLALSQAVEGQSLLHNAALPLMHRVRDRTGESVALWVRQGLTRVCVAQVTGNDHVRRIYVVGEVENLWPPASAGRALMAYMPPHERQLLLKQEDVHAEQFEQELISVRELGYAITRGERLIDSGGVSAAILDFRSECVGAINVGVPLSRFTEDLIPVLVEEVKSAAAMISSLMGYSQTTNS